MKINKKINNFKIFLLLTSIIFFTGCSFLEMMGMSKTSSYLGGRAYIAKGYKFDGRIKGILEIGASLKFINENLSDKFENHIMKVSYVYINIYDKNRNLELLEKGTITYKGKKYYFNNSNIEIHGYNKKIDMEKLGIDMRTKNKENDSFILELGKIKLGDRIIDMDPLIMEKTYVRVTTTSSKAGTRMHHDWVGYPEDYFKKYSE